MTVFLEENIPNGTPPGINTHHTFVKFAHNTGQVVHEVINSTRSEVGILALFPQPGQREESPGGLFFQKPPFSSRKAGS